MSYYMNDMTREELYSVIDRMKRQINTLETDLIKSQTILKSYEKYFNYFNEINESISTNNEILVLIENLKKLRQFSNNCLVSATKIPTNDFNRLRLKSVQRNVESTDVWTQTFFKPIPQSTQMEDNYEKNSNESDVSLDLQNMKTELFFSDNEVNDNYFQNENQLITENIRNFETINNQMFFEDNDCDFNANEDNFKDLKTELMSDTEVDNNWDQNENQNINENTSFGTNDNQSLSEDNSDLSELEDIFSDSDSTDSEDTFSYTSDEEWVHSKSKNEVFICKFEGCSSQFYTIRSLRKHKIRHTDKYRCDVKDCHFKGGSNYHLKRHKDGFHSSAKTKGLTICCKFEGCSAKFRTKKSLKNHEFKHTAQYICDFEGCAHKAVSNYDLKRHQNNKHSKDMPFICCAEDCVKRFKIRADLKQHLKRYHSDLTLYDCEYPECGQTFADQMSLTNHEGIHSGHLFCHFEGCDFDTSAQIHLERHFKSKHKSYICSQTGCGKEFTNSSLLVEHKRIHQKMTYECQWEGCHRTFALKNYLKRHLNIHKGRFSCEWKGCHFRAETPYYLRLHESKHSNEQPFECLIDGCAKRFKHKLYMSRHQLTAHPNQFGDIPWIECKENDCSYKTKFGSSFREHTTKVHPLHLHACEWYGCESAFKDKQHLKNHMNVHTGDKIYQCEWPGCDKTFYLKSSFSVHMKNHGKGLQFN